ncbi:hypothetical protein JR316_0012639 [Psilocybe cubensis]|nr:hypothetical protein JR316_0012639 [Psilocybe cubensis]KAH9475524.1 hypothetical protein JR316_0012639 [Psilocybe cubensis]
MIRNREPLPVPPPSPSDSDTLRVSESTASDSTCLELSNDNDIQDEGNKRKKVMFHAVTLVIDAGPENDMSQKSTSDESKFLRTAFSSYDYETKDVAEDLSDSGPASPSDTGEKTDASIRILKFLITTGSSTHTFECPAILSKCISELFPPLVSITETIPTVSLLRAAALTPLASTIEQKSSDLGMFADQDIAQGQCILSERPCLVSIYSILDGNHREELAQLFDNLNPETTDEAISLLSPDDSEDSVWYEQIMRRHSFVIPLSSSTLEGCEDALKHRGLFLKSSRIRHSCTPNARWGWNTKSFSLRVFALQPISEGMEITVAKIKLDTLQASGSPTGFKCISKACVGHCANSPFHPHTTQLDKPKQTTNHEERTQYSC